MTTATPHLTEDPQSHDARVGERVLMLMFRARLSQTALGKRIGMTQSALSHKIRGARKWTLDDLYAISHALGVSIYDLLGNDETAPTPKGEGRKLPELDSNQQPAGIKPLAPVTRLEPRAAAPAERPQLAPVHVIGGRR